MLLVFNPSGVAGGRATPNFGCKCKFVQQKLTKFIGLPASGGYEIFIYVLPLCLVNKVEYKTGFHRFSWPEHATDPAEELARFPPSKNCPRFRPSSNFWLHIYHIWISLQSVLNLNPRKLVHTSHTTPNNFRMKPKTTRSFYLYIRYWYAWVSLMV